MVAPATGSGEPYVPASGAVSPGRLPVPNCHDDDSGLAPTNPLLASSPKQLAPPGQLPPSNPLASLAAPNQLSAGRFGANVPPMRGSAPPPGRACCRGRHCLRRASPAGTLAAGALFGFWVALVLVSFASSVGATLAFLASRFLFKDAVQSRFGERLKKINAGVAKDGAFYLFTLRLIPAFPFFVINLVMGLTSFGTVYVFTRLLGADDYGRYALVLAGMQLAWPRT